ncbi:MAG: hypothetical protein ABF289_01560 [Clostridiales bacterium]
MKFLIMPYILYLKPQSEKQPSVVVIIGKCGLKLIKSPGIGSTMNLL